MDRDDEQLLRRRVYGADHDRPGPRPERHYVELGLGEVWSIAARCAMSGWLGSGGLEAQVPLLNGPQL